MEVLVANRDHTAPGKLTTHMGMRALGILMAIVCTINAVPRVIVLIVMFIHLLETFNRFVNEGELDQPSAHVVKWGCLMEGSSRCATCVIGVAWFRAVFWICRGNGSSGSCPSLLTFLGVGVNRIYLRLPRESVNEGGGGA